MRRLINWLYEALLGLRVRSREQHIADLETRLSILRDAKAAIEAEIRQTATRLNDAKEQHHRLSQEA